MNKIFTRVVFWGMLLITCLWASLQGYAQVPAMSYGAKKIFVAGVPITPVAPLNTGGVVPATPYGTVSTFEKNPVTGIAVDTAGNIYAALSTDNLIEEVSPAGDTTTVMLGFNNPQGMAIDKYGYAYVVNKGEGSAWMVSIPAGVVRVLATGLKAPTGITVDTLGNVYIAENTGNDAIKIARDGTKSVIAAGLNAPYGIAADAAGNVYVTDTGNGAVKKIAAADGQVSTYASGLNMPTGIAVDNFGNVHVADYTNGNILKLPNPAIGGQPIIVSSKYNKPKGIAFDKVGNLYIADTGNLRGKMLTLTGYSISPALPAGFVFNTSTGIISGKPTASSPAADYIITAYNTSGYSADTLNIGVNNANLTKLAINSGTLAPVFATAKTAYTVNVNNKISSVKITPTTSDTTATIKINGIVAKSGVLSASVPLIVGSNVITIAVTNPDSTTKTIYTIAVKRSVPLSATLSSLVISTGTITPALTKGIKTYTTSVSGSVSSIIVTPTSSVTSASIKVNGVVVKTGVASASIPLVEGPNIITIKVTSADSTVNYNLVVTRQMPPPDIDYGGSKAFIAGVPASAVPVNTGGVIPLSSGFGVQSNIGLDSASFSGVVVDDLGNIYAPDPDHNAIVLKTFAGADTSINLGFASPQGIAVDAQGNIYVADSGNGAVKKISAALDSVSTLASGLLNPTGVVLDDDNNIYVVENTGNDIKKISVADSSITTIASGLNSPFAMATDGKGSLYVTNTGDNTIKKITITNGGVGNLEGSFGTPSGLVIDANGVIYIADEATGNIFRQPVIGQATVISSGYNNPQGIALSASGDLFIADKGNNEVKKLTLTGYAISPALPTGLIFNNSTGIISGIPLTAGPVAEYTVTAYNVGGSSSDNVMISITNASLSALAISSGTLAPVFSTGVINYNAAVDNQTDSVTVTPASSDSTAVITVNDIPVVSGAASQSLPLIIGNNIITTVVKDSANTSSAAYTITLKRAGSSNAKLSSLNLSSGTLSPQFLTDSTNYTAVVNDSISSINITAVTSDSTATIKINGTSVISGLASPAIPLVTGINTIPVAVMAQDSSVVTYTVTLTRLKSSDAKLGSLTISGGTLSPQFLPDNRNYTVAVGNTIASITITPTANNATASILVNGTTVVSGTASTSIPLITGNNTIAIMVTAADGTIINYTLSVNRLIPIPTLSYTTPNIYTVGVVIPNLTPTGSGAVTYNVSPALPLGLIIDSLTGIISGLPTANSPATNYTITGQNSGGSVSKIVNIKVLPNASLSGLTISGGQLSPAFSQQQYNYAASVDNAVSSVTITPASLYATSAIKVNGKLVVSQTPSVAISLNMGNNTITVVSTANDGITTKTYTIILNRASPIYNPNLSSLALSGVTLVPAFTPTVTNYKAAVPNSVSTTKVIYTAGDSGSTIMVNGVVYRGTSGNIPLSIGLNTITALVTAKDGITKKTYTTIVTRAKATQLITFTNTSRTYGDADFSPASSSSKLLVTYASSNTKVASIVAGKVHAVAAGTVTITANQAGDANYAPAIKVGQQILINKKNQTIKFISISPALGGADFSPASASSGLSVSYVSSNTKVAAIVAGKVHAVAPGTVTITASQAGNANYTAAKNLSHSVIINKESQSIRFITTTQTFGGADFAPATASSSLPVTYVSSNTKMATIVAGKVHAIAAGTVTITANQAGNTKYAAAKALAQSITIGKANQVISFTTSRTIFGNADFAPARASSGLAVKYTSSDTKLATIINGKIHITGGGTVIITASQAGNGNYAAAKNISKTIVISRAPQTITYAAMPAHTYGDKDFSPGTTASSGLAVSYISLDPKIATIVNGKVHILAAGKVTVKALQAGNNNFAAATNVTRAITISKAALTIKANDETKVAGKINPVFTATYSGFIKGEDKNELTAQPKFTTTATTNSKAGVYSINVSGAKDNNYIITYIPGKLTIKTVAGIVHSVTPTVPPVATDFTAEPEQQQLPAPEVSQAVSPNGDGINDVLEIKNIGNYPDNRLTLMDKNGALIYTASGYDNVNKVFNGHSNVTGAMLKPGTFYYLLEYKDKGVTKKLSGFFLIKY